MNTSDMWLARFGMMIYEKRIKGRKYLPLCFSMIVLLYFYSSTLVYSITKSIFLISELVGIVSWKLVSLMF